MVRSPNVMETHRRQALAALATIGLIAMACGGNDASSPAAAATEAPATPAPVITPGPTDTPAATPAPSDEPATAAVSGAPTSLLTTAMEGDRVAAPPLEGLVLPDSSEFELASLQGEPLLVFFGYTHCPDVCPATIGELFGVFEAEPTAQALFVSVDPERDTPEFLEEWTQYLPDNLYAVTGTPGAIRRAADSYGVKYARVETTSTAGYTMSHTAELYLIDADGNLLLAYPFGTPAAEIVEDLRTLDAS